jgi:hypothetical protein
MKQVMSESLETTINCLYSGDHTYNLHTNCRRCLPTVLKNLQKPRGFGNKYSYLMGLLRLIGAVVHLSQGQRQNWEYSAQLAPCERSSDQRCHGWFVSSYLVR